MFNLAETFLDIHGCVKVHVGPSCLASQARSSPVLMNPRRRKEKMGVQSLKGLWWPRCFPPSMS